jgi:hypothetical protein
MFAFVTRSLVADRQLFDFAMIVDVLFWIEFYVWNMLCGKFSSPLKGASVFNIREGWLMWQKIFCTTRQYEYWFLCSYVEILIVILDWFYDAFTSPGIAGPT